MAVGNTFGATALSSFGGFWMSYALIFTPSLAVTDAYAGTNQTDGALGFFLTGWFIFTTILLLCTMRSTIMFFGLFFTLDLAFLFLACADYATQNGAANAASGLQTAGGVFGMLAAFLAWYNAFAGLADSRLVQMALGVYDLPFMVKWLIYHNSQQLLLPRPCLPLPLEREGPRDPHGQGSVTHRLSEKDGTWGRCACPPAIFYFSFSVQNSATTCLLLRLCVISRL